jgi:hypothetical protein
MHDDHVAEVDSFNRRDGSLFLYDAMPTVRALPCHNDGHTEVFVESGALLRASAVMQPTGQE